MHPYLEYQARKARKAEAKIARFYGKPFESLTIGEIMAFNEKPAIVEVVNGKRIKCYDLPKYADRYTVVYIDDVFSRVDDGRRESVSMSALPFHPQGIGMHGAAMIGPHLGRRIAFKNLPDDCRKLVENDTREA